MASAHARHLTIMADRNLRRLPLLALIGCAFVLTLTCAALAGVPSVRTVGMTVADADASAEFFERVLGFEVVSDHEVAGPAYEHLQAVFALRMRVVRMRLGSETVELTQYLAPSGRRFPEDARPNDLWFQHVAIVVSDMARAYAHLREHRVAHASSGPQRLPESLGTAAGIEAFYFRDPDGHFLEVIAYPPGKGDPRWQDESRLFLGIDHTAIVVADTEASLAFYRDGLGLRLDGESENHGSEQEHLSGVFGARVRITALRGESGPGIELLEYVSPGPGRARPTDARASDLLHWHVDLDSADLESAAASLRQMHAALDSPGIVDVDGTLGFARAISFADPDGHRLRFLESGSHAGANRSR